MKQTKKKTVVINEVNVPGANLMSYTKKVTIMQQNLIIFNN